jgi:ectoine hydroxylase-related dioxygenase (phytanoyl-CoA dioxygenase family)
MLSMTASLDELDQTADLSPDEIGRFDRDGFVKLTGILDPDVVRRYETDITSKVIELNTQHLPLEERDTYGKAFLQVTNLWRRSERVKELVFSKRLAKIAADLLAVKGVRLYHDQALYKEAGGGITPWHADQYFWPLSSDRTLTAWIPLQDTPLDMGPLSFARASHHFSFGRDLGITDESERTMQTALSDQSFTLIESAYRLGDVSFHAGWTFHRAEENRSDRPRAVMTMIYMDADIEIVEPSTTYQRRDYEAFLAPARPGHPPTGELTPVLYAET